MSRGNYYYARGWVGGGSARSWTLGEIAGFNNYEDGLVTSLQFMILGVMLQAFSAFADVSWLSGTLPLFSFMIGVVGIVSMFSMPKKGLWYVGGWTFVAYLLFTYGLIGTGEFLTDLIPLGMIIVYVIYAISKYGSLTE